MSKPKAQVRKAKYVPQEYRDPTRDYLKEAETLMWTDENGRPISRVDLINYDTSDRTVFEPSNILSSPQSDYYDLSFLNNEKRKLKAQETILNNKAVVSSVLDFVPIAGDIKGGYEGILQPLQQGDYLTAGLGTGMLFLPNFIEKPLKRVGKGIKKLYNNYKDYRELRNIYKRVGTGLRNPHIKAHYNEAKKDRKTALKFLNDYSSQDITGDPMTNDLSIEQMKDAIQKLDKIEKTTGTKIRLNTQRNMYNEDIKSIEESALLAIEDASKYFNELNEIKNKSTILANIAKESPAYLKLIYEDLISGKIEDVTNYVLDLVKQANTFLRRMNIDSNYSEAFTTIRGRSHGNFSNYSIDVGNQPVVFDPVFGREYGNVVGTYTPKWELTGDVSTWWSQRFPKFNDESITISTGMHLDRPPFHRSKDVYNKVLRKLGVPDNYGITKSHLVFRSKNKNASISDMYNVNFDYSPDKPIRYSLGYKTGGKLKNNVN